MRKKRRINFFALLHTFICKCDSLSLWQCDVSPYTCIIMSPCNLGTMQLDIRRLSWRICFIVHFFLLPTDILPYFPTPFRLHVAHMCVQHGHLFAKNVFGRVELSRYPWQQWNKGALCFIHQSNHCAMCTCDHITGSDHICHLPCYSLFRSLCILVVNRIFKVST